MIEIYVVCHKPSIVPKNEFFKPIQVGSALSDIHFSGMLSDDMSADNISGKNGTYCELTAQYCIWKKLTEEKRAGTSDKDTDTDTDTDTDMDPDNDYIGFQHYRRYFSFHQPVIPMADGTLTKADSRICPNIELDSITCDLRPFGIDEETMASVIGKADILTVLRERINTSVYRQYVQFHEKGPLKDIIGILREKYPEYEEAVKKYLGSKEIYYMNMFIMKKDLFLEYASWLFDLLEAYERTSGYQEAVQKDQRLMGFLGERLFGIFYTKKLTDGIRAIELPYLRFYHTEPDQDPHEAVTYIREFRVSPFPFPIRIDMRKLNRWFPSGSRRRLLLRGLIFRD